MKTLTQYITEKLMSLEEMISDYTNLVESPDTTTKKNLASKYGIVSKKAADIQQAILIAMRNERKDRHNFTEDDILYFRRLSGMPSRYKTLCVWLEDESLDFVKFMKDFYEQKLKSNKSRLGTLFDLKGSTRGRDWNYFMSASDKFQIDTYNNLVQYIDEHEPSKISSRQEQQIVINSIKQKLIENTKEFHDEYINKVEVFANKYWDSLPENIEKSKKAYDELKNQYNNETDSKQIRVIKYQMEEALKTYNRYVFVSKNFSSKTDYVNKCIEDAEIKFDNNITNIADRIKQQNFVITDIKVEDIKNDPKFYEMYITDGVKRVHCRSIWAAEFSDKMIPHFRFIITNRK